MKISPRLRRWLIVGATLAVVYAIAGFFVAPAILRGQLVRRGADALHRPVKLSAVKVNPFAMSVTVDGLVVTDHDQSELASWERIYVNFDPLMSLFLWQWHLGEVRIVHPRKRLVIDTAGRLNIADLFPVATATAETATAPPAPPVALPYVGVGLLRVENWEFEFTDQSRRSRFHTKAGPLSFELRDFTTRPDNDGPYSFVGSTDSIQRLAWSGTVSAAPPGSKGRMEIENISLPPLMPFLEEHFHGEVAHGRVSLVVNYEAGLDGDPFARITDSTITVDDLGVRAHGAPEAAVSWQKLEITIERADLLARTARVTRVALTGLDGKVERLADGSIDLLALLPQPSAADAEPAADPGPAPSVQVASIELIDARLRFTDRTLPRPGVITLDQINATALNAGTDLDREIKLDVKARWDGSGTLATAGLVRVLPLAASLDVEGTGLTLQPLESWIEPLARVRIAGGTEHFRGHIDASQARGDPLSLTWRGDSGVDNLDVRDAATGAMLLAWDSLTYTDTRFNLTPMEISAGEIALTNPRAHVAIDETGALNLSSLVPSAETDATAPESTFGGTEYTAAPADQPLPFTARVGAVTISGGKVSVVDRSVPGGFSTELRDFSGSIRGLSSENLARADVEFSASLDGVAPLRIKGTINPIAEDQFSDVTVSFSNIDLPLFTPYASKYLGQKIQKGKLNVAVNYRLSQNLLEAENNATLDQFYLGEKVDSPDAIKAPIGLVLAILRERDGKIPLHMPIRGSLDDPDFKYGQLVMQFLGNLLTKAATSPFKMLGGMFGGGRELDLSFVEFASGATAFSERALDKIGVLQKALTERPALRLEISSPPSADGDRAGLREQRLHAQLRAARATPSDAELAPEEIDELVRAEFARQFPEEAATAMPAEADTSTAVTTPVATGETKKPGLLHRLTFGILGGDKPPAPPAPAPEPVATPAAPATAENAPPPLISVAEMRARLLDAIPLTDADFQELASARARAVREQLLAAGTIEAERVFLVTDPQVPEGANNAIDGGRVFFGLE